MVFLAPPALPLHCTEGVVPGFLSDAEACSEQACSQLGQNQCMTRSLAMHLMYTIDMLGKAAPLEAQATGLRLVCLSNCQLEVSCCVPLDQVHPTLHMVCVGELQAAQP